MVVIADDSHHGFSYREINQQLARENGELRQQIASAIEGKARLEQELLRRDVQILDLQHRINDLVSKVNELTNFRSKLDAIRGIVLEDDATMNLTRDMALQPGSSSPIRALPSTSLNNSPSGLSTPVESGSQNCTLTSELPSVSSRDSIGPDGAGDQSLASHSDTMTRQASTSLIDNSSASLASPTTPPSSETTTTQAPISPPSTIVRHDAPSALTTIVEENDSLVPQDVTSVPRIDAPPEHTIATPSIWNCFDSLEEMDMLQSTPSQPSARPTSLKLNSPWVWAATRQSTTPPDGQQQQQRKQILEQTPPPPSQRPVSSAVRSPGRERPRMAGPEENEAEKEEEEAKGGLRRERCERPKRGRGRKIQAECRARREVTYGPAGDAGGQQQQEKEDKAASPPTKMIMTTTTTTTTTNHDQPKVRADAEPRRYNLRKRSRC